MCVGVCKGETRTYGFEFGCGCLCLGSFCLVTCVRVWVWGVGVGLGSFFLAGCVYSGISEFVLGKTAGQILTV